MHRAENTEIAVAASAPGKADQATTHLADWKIALQPGNDGINEDAEVFEQLFVKNWYVANKYVRWRGFNYHEAEAFDSRPSSSRCCKAKHSKDTTRRKDHSGHFCMDP